jgi:hypothetical protein
MAQRAAVDVAAPCSLGDLPGLTPPPFVAGEPLPAPPPPAAAPATARAPRSWAPPPLPRARQLSLFDHL